MVRSPIRRRWLAANVAGGLSLLLPAARACDFFTTTLRVYHPWSRATAPGDPFAILCMSFDQVAQDDRLIGLETPVAEAADLGGIGGAAKLDLPIPAGRETVLTEAGRFIRLLGLRQPLQVGRSYPLQLLFERGGALSADIDIDYERKA